jgi:ABC-2 type transport system ATP-binding protein
MRRPDAAPTFDRAERLPSGGAGGSTPGADTEPVPAVVIRDLRREFDDREVVRGISLEIRKGEIFGLLGPNGAGKTTTISMVSTRIRPTSGEVWIEGLSVSRDVNGARRLLNVAPQDEALYPSLSGEENLRFVARLYGVPRRERRQRVAEALELVQLTARKDDLVATYSGGMRRRLNLGCALVSGPQVLLLDEPTAGVDPQSRVHIYDAVRQLRARGITIVYTTHYLAEAEHLCDRIAIMDEGRIVALGTLPELLALSHASEVIELTLARVPGNLAAVERLDGVLRTELAGTHLRVFTTRAQRVLAALCGTRPVLDIPIVSTKVTPITLEAVFIELTGKELRD